VNKSNVSTLILVPSSDLAAQVCAAADQLCRALDLRVTLLQIGDGLRKQHQWRDFAYRRSAINSKNKAPSSAFSRIHRALLSGSQIIVSSPGRFASQHSLFGLDALQFSVIDEAERMLNQSYQNWAYILNNDRHKRAYNRILIRTGQRAKAKRHFQVILCSASLTKDDVQGIDLFAPETITDDIEICQPVLP
jgi:ATP-dependent RNA helicase DDX51/DBP6